MLITTCRLAGFMSISPEQCRAARALIGWTRHTLAWASDISERTLIEFERQARSPQRRTLAGLRSTLEDADVLFIDQNEEGGPGVRVREHI